MATIQEIEKLLDAKLNPIMDMMKAITKHLNIQPVTEPVTEPLTNHDNTIEITEPENTITNTEQVIKPKKEKTYIMIPIFRPYLITIKSNTIKIYPLMKI